MQNNLQILFVIRFRSNRIGRVVAMTYEEMSGDLQMMYWVLRMARLLKTDIRRPRSYRVAWRIFVFDHDCTSSVGTQLGVGLLLS
jgi:hypothetical protein